MKIKTLAIVEIVIVLCSVFLVAIPTIAAEQNQAMQKVSASTITTLSEDDYVLDIYGNANEDDTIDMGDVVYVKLAIFGKKPKTELCDAKYDGRINVLDIIQTKLIILGKEKELTFEDIFGDVVTVPKPVKRIVTMKPGPPEAIQVLDATDKVVGVSGDICKIALPRLSKLPSVGSWMNPDYEAILSLNPDVFMSWASVSQSSIKRHEEYKEKLPGVTVIPLQLSTSESFTENLRKLGYILDKKEEAEEFIDWHEEYMNKIKAQTDGLSDDEKPRVYIEWVSDYKMLSTSYPACEIAGGIDITADIKGKVDPEFVIEQNPDIIVRREYYASHGYTVDDPSEMKEVRDSIMNRPELANIAAVKKESVYLISEKHLRLGPYHIIFCAYLAKWFHPELFEDLDPQAIHQEYLDRFQRIDFNVKEHGVFVYPKELVS